MEKIIHHAKEQKRLEALLNYKILDTPPEEELDAITKLATYICQTPIALISLIDDKRQWFKSNIGIGVAETAREISFCEHAILEDRLFEVPDATEDERFASNPLVTGDPNIRFYTGTQLKTTAGYNIGTLCVIDTVPRNLTVQQKESLITLGKQVILQLELREKNMQLATQVKQLAADNEEILSITKLLEKQNKDLENANKEITVAETFFSLSLDLLFVATTEYFTKVNPAFTKILGFDEDLLLKTPFMNFVHPDDIAAALEELVKIDKGIPTTHFVARFKCKGEKYRWLDFNVCPDAASGLRYGVAHDITEIKIIEEELTTAKELAEKSVNIKDRFLANMSHEIRTPLNAIIGFTDLLEPTSLNKTQKEYINSIQVAGENLLLIINDILDLSKIDSGNLSIETQPFNIQTTLKHVADLLKEKVQIGVKFNILLDSNLPEIVIGDHGRLNQILVNLVGNALKFTLKGKVTVSVEKLEEEDDHFMIKFIVKDTGIGIPQDKLKTIFDRFTQAEDDTNRRFGGTGLGLNIVKQLVELHNSEIHVKSNHKHGSEFSFVIKYAKPINTEPINNHVIQHNLGNLKILLCEDNVLNQKLTKIVINNFGFDLDIAENGIEGLELLAINKYDLILMDLQMPLKNGYQTAEYIRSELKLNVPIIAMSAHSILGEKEHCFSIGMNEFVTKPFKQAELLDAIKLVLKSDNKQEIREIDFSFVDELSCGNEIFKQEMIDLFVQNVPNEINALQHAIIQNDFATTLRIIHKLKSTMDIFMLKNIVKKLSIIEQGAKINQFSNNVLHHSDLLQQEIIKIVKSLKEKSITN